MNWKGIGFRVVRVLMIGEDDGLLIVALEGDGACWKSR